MQGALGLVGTVKLAGMLRIKNEARWIREVLESALRVCDQVFVMDDHSTDDTREICSSLPGVALYGSPFEGLDEARDKNWLFGLIQRSHPEWVLAIDGDELLMEPDHSKIRESVNGGGSDCYALRVLYLWDRTDQVRTDGVYGRFWRPSLFRLRPGDSFCATRNGGNFHCGNVPQEFLSSARCNARLLHFGYMDAADRKRKFEWYNQNDPHNLVEDCYRHMVQGDPGGPAAHFQLRHAGPLSLVDF